MTANHQLIHKGARWRIGTRHKVSIWKETWLPNQHYPYIETPPSPLLEHATVNSRAGNQPSRAEPSFEHFELGLLIYE